MTAELLREAAALMRKQAEAATPGPWISRATSTAHAVTGMGRNVVITPQTRVSCANVEHIASWHPAMALAVADLLDEAADHLEAKSDVADDSAWLCGTAKEGLSCSVMEKALAVARAYLGTNAPTIKETP